jgi:hypothetical protein
LGSLKGTDHSQNLGGNRNIIYKCILGTQNWEMWIGLNRLRLRTIDGGFVSTRQRNVGYHKRWRIVWFADFATSFSSRTLQYGINYRGIFIERSYTHTHTRRIVERVFRFSRPWRCRSWSSGFNTVWIWMLKPTFRRSTFVGILSPEGGTFLRNAEIHIQAYTALQCSPHVRQLTHVLFVLISTQMSVSKFNWNMHLPQSGRWSSCKIY